MSFPGGISNARIILKNARTLPPAVQRVSYCGK
jgi:hypothetical protein